MAKTKSVNKTIQEVIDEFPTQRQAAEFFEAREETINRWYNGHQSPRTLAHKNKAKSRGWIDNGA